MINQNFKKTIRLEKAKGYDYLYENDPGSLLDLIEVVEKHFLSVEKWISGRAVRIFKANETLAVEYESGDWWHYTSSSWY